MSNSPSRIIDNQLILRKHEATVITVTTAETGLLIYPRSHIKYKAIFDIGAFNIAGTYNINLEISDLETGTYSVLATLTDTVIKLNGENSSIEIALSGNQAFAVDNDANYLRVNAVLGGTASLNYGCFLTII